MKRPVIGTLAILALLGGGVYFAFRYQDAARSQGTPNPCYEGAAARLRFREQFDVLLPNSADRIHYCIESLESTQLVFARFDVPAIEMIDLLGKHDRLPGYGDLKPDADLVRTMSDLASPRRDWWRIDEKPAGGKAVAAQRSGKGVLTSAAIKWRAQVCAVPVSGETTRVFVAFSEEPQTEP